MSSCRATNAKTAAELRELAYMFPSGTWRALLLHHAAVEEEREAAMDPADRPCLDCGNDGTKLGCNKDMTNGMTEYARLEVET